MIAAPLDGPPLRVEPIAAEEPLEIRVRGSAFAVLLRTPGRERDLIAGFLAAERLIRGPEDLLGVEPCTDPASAEVAPNVWNAALAEGVTFDPRSARALTVGSACGLCGARSIEDLRLHLPRRKSAPPEAPAEALRAAMLAMRAQQDLFARTAGTHGVALAWAVEGGALELADVAEDVGRHNAADKVLGAALRAGNYPIERPAWLLVSGRISFEIVQKAALAGIGAVAGVGMPTTMAVSAAHACGLGLHGFVREDGGFRYAPDPAS